MKCSNCGNEIDEKDVRQKPSNTFNPNEKKKSNKITKPSEQGGFFIAFLGKKCIFK